MVLFCTALFAEAAPIIAKLNMKPAAAGRLRLYECESARLTVTGTGSVRAACALTEALCAYPDTDVVVNAGCCGGTDAGLYRIGKITDASGHDHYPGIDSGRIPIASLMTLEAPSDDYREGMLYDMEAAGIYQAARRLVGTYSVLIYKYVTDSDGFGGLSADDVRAVAAKYSGRICEDVFRHVSERAPENADISARREALTALLPEGYHISRTMRYELSDILRSIAFGTQTKRERAAQLLREFGENPPSGRKKEDREAVGRLREELVRLAFSEPDEDTACLRAQDPAVVYVEKELLGDEKTQGIIKRLGAKHVIYVRHYKDILDRAPGDYMFARAHRAYVLARRGDGYLYRGAKVCQDFGNDRFFYTSMIMNCPFSCEYCYLAGMYPNPAIVAFTDFEEYFRRVEEELLNGPMYLCVSFDTDMPAMEGVLGYCEKWCDFASSHPDITIEIRTKSNAALFLNRIEGRSIPENVILAWTISPQPVIDMYEKAAAPYSQRVEAMRRASDMGFSVRACFDPMIYTPDFEKVYGEMIEDFFADPVSRRVKDFGVGVFRIGRDHLGVMRKNCPGSALCSKPYEVDEKVFTYPKDISRRMMGFVMEKIGEHVSPEKIFTSNW